LPEVDSKHEYDAVDGGRWHVLVGGVLCYGFDALDFMMLALALPMLIREWHLTLTEAGLLGTAGMIGVGLSGLVLGWFADMYGRRRALLLSVVVFALFTAAVALARTRWELMGLRFVAGFGLGGVWGAITALIKESWPRAQRARAISWVLSTWPVGVSLAAVLAGVVLPRYGWRGLFLCGGAALLAALYVFVFVPESARWRAQRLQSVDSARVSVQEIFAPGNRWNTIFGTAVAASALTAYWGMNTWLPTYLVNDRGLDSPTMARYVLLLNAGMFCGYPLLGMLGDRIGKRRALVLSFAAAGILIPVYSVVRNLTALLWMGPLVSLFFAQTGLIGAYFPELFPTHVRSLGAGFCFNVGRGLAAFAPMLLGHLATAFGLAAGIALCGVSYLFAGLLTLFLPQYPPFATDDGVELANTSSSFATEPRSRIAS
jgi:MFS family permease